jgi:glutathione peroxidase
MRYILFMMLPVLLACSHFDRVRVGPVSAPIPKPSLPAMSFYQLSATDINGNLLKMEQFRGKKLLVVNTASECGFTPQYQQLQELYEMYKDKGLVVIGFPSNDFGGQEPGTETDIATFCQKNYGVTFPMMAKVSIKGEDPHPVYHWLTSKEQNGVSDATVEWNFNKFLIDEQGRWVKHYGAKTEPLDDRILEWLDK